jgi:hypothetical protein
MLAEPCAEKRSTFVSRFVPSLSWQMMFVFHQNGQFKRVAFSARTRARIAAGAGRKMIVSQPPVLPFTAVSMPASVL